MPLSADRLGVLVHELRSPVAALTALAEAAGASALREPGERRRLVELAAAACRDIDRLLSDPELFSVRPHAVGLAALVDAVAGPTVRVDVAGGLVVWADPVRLRQALANLVANGLRHGSNVRIAASETPSGIRIVVEDDGPGVDPGIDVFAPGASGAGSTGYGLWLARAVVEAHGGTLALEPAPGSGARFTLALPRAADGP